MARFLALDGDQSQFQLIAVTVNRDVVRVERVLSYAEELPLGVANAEMAGKRLRDKLKEAGIAPAPLLACVGRERVILKDIKHPPCPPPDEPALVRFQVMKEITESAEDVVIDYQPSQTEGELRKATAVVLRRDLLAAYRTFAEAAGLKLQGITPRPFAAFNGLTQAANKSDPAETPGPAGCVAVLTRGEKWGEFAVYQDGRLVFARNFGGPSLTNENALRGELKRNLAGFTAQSNLTVRALYIAEGHGGDPAARARLAEALGVEVYSFDPLVGVDGVPPGQRGAYAGLMGLAALADRAGTPLPINFVTPRQPKAAADPNNKRYLVYGLLAAILLMALGGGFWWILADKDKQISRLAEEKAELDQQLAVLSLDEKRIKALEEWGATEVVWLDELYDLTARFPDPSRLRLTSIVGEPLSRTAKGKHIARVTLKGLGGDDSRPIESLLGELVKESKYRVEPKEVRPNNSGFERGRFSQQFSTRFELEYRSFKDYVLRFTAKPPERRGPARDDVPDFGFGAFGLGGQ